VKPLLLVDEAVLDGRAAALPLSWLDGMALLPYPPRHLERAQPADLARADGVLLRSVTRLDHALRLRMPQLRAVATLSSGLDHIDPRALQAGPRAAAVALCSGHGGNAIAVAQWVTWALQRLSAPLVGLRVLVVGMGAVGTAVAQHLASCGAQPLPCDPPRAARGTLPDHRDLDDWIATRPDAVTLHVPLTRPGEQPWPTAGMLDASRLGRLQGAVVLQASRGGVLDEAAAARLRGDGWLRGLAIDTWIGEPSPQPEVLSAVDLGTPHIAGHTAEGKADVAWRAVSRLRRVWDLPELPPLAHVWAALPPPAQPPDAALDAVAAALCAGDDFETLRHHHYRRQGQPG
jgi:erythronate-4-phosphate dehydrogenase